MNFAAGGVIQVENSFGELNIAAWDQPSVQIIATRFTYRENTPKEKERTSEKLKRIQVTKTIGNNGDLTISTTGKHALGIDMDYQIMVPRTARLVIHHRTGAVFVLDVSGDINASAHIGDILVQLPQAQHEVIDARTRIGAIYSDYGRAGVRHLVGSEPQFRMRLPRM